mmetsp:Transcript_17231/g.60163  ORF Transcript_17231/g.60163 Transcript_17231/m.60163 type:complete len:226 (+) Transcript_17231:771-1448(+)
MVGDVRQQPLQKLPGVLSLLLQSQHIPSGPQFRKGEACGFALLDRSPQSLHLHQSQGLLKHVPGSHFTLLCLHDMQRPRKILCAKAGCLGLGDGQFQWFDHSSTLALQSHRQPCACPSADRLVKQLPDAQKFQLDEPCFLASHNNLCQVCNVASTLLDEAAAFGDVHLWLFVFVLVARGRGCSSGSFGEGKSLGSLALHLRDGCPSFQSMLLGLHDATAALQLTV